MGRQIIPTFTASIPEVAASRLVITGWSSSSFGLLNHHNNTGIAKENINHPFTGANQESTVKQGTKQKTARSMREPKTLPSMCKNLGWEWKHKLVLKYYSLMRRWETGVTADTWKQRLHQQVGPGRTAARNCTWKEKESKSQKRGGGGDRQPRPWQTIRYVNKISQTQWRFKFLYLS